MTHHTRTAFRGMAPTPQVCDVSAGSIRMAWACPKTAPAGDEDPDLAALRREEALHELFQRLFMRTTERYLKGELDARPPETPRDR